MAQQNINIGTNPNDGTGDALRTAFTKINAMFTELYNLAVAPVLSVAGRTGAVTLSTADITDAGATGVALAKSATAATARSTLGLDTGNSPTFQALTLAGDLTAGTGKVATKSGAVNTQTTNYTVNAADNGGIIAFNASSGVTCTVPSGLGKGFACTIIQQGAGQVTISGSGATINSISNLSKTAGQYAVASLFAYAADTFALGGSLA